MDVQKVKNAFEKVKAEKKRNFTQSYDLIVKLTNLDLTKNEQRVDFFVNLHHPKGKDIKVCAFVGPELKAEAEKNCELVIPIDDFSKYTDKKKMVQLAESYDFFIAQANIMPKVAQTFGKVLGVRGKMPNPKLGCVVPPKAQLAPLKDKLNKTLRLRSGKAPMLQTVVGTEAMEDKDVIDNIATTIDQLLHHLPTSENNISRLMLKKTMGEIVDIK